ncbi:isoflavone-7-O-methyltransferase 9 [Medicago truncatula]|uniref:isoflavone 7-O-methyltransferase n=1 Tax=Medicago truncatula TaxID=3880 RepID=A0A072UMS9_MEDTR|nr:isoflavone-7-O-methyltransferase 9 [Medicago truncatula]KEH30982.1 isoflavone-7-O-methyltransferase [Medicago truncatula]
MASKNDLYKPSELFQAQTHLYKIMYGFLNPMSVKWALDLKIPDIIHNHGHAMTLSELISSLKVPQSKETCVRRLMRLLAHIDFFAIVKIDETKEGYALTPTSQLLVSDTDHCLSSMVRLLNTPTLVDAYNHLGKWTCGEDLTIVETALGPESYWDFIHENSAYLKSFNDAMESDSHVVRLALRDCNSVFEGIGSLVDVGGGTGNTAKIICEAFPELKYTVLDLPQVVSGLTGSINLSFVGGNMFKSIPQADTVLLKWVLHNWGDDDCIKILKNCKKAISGKEKGGKVIIIDVVINEKQDEHEMTEVKLLLDVVMMTSLNGKERNEKEWKQLFLQAGFKYYKIFPTFGFRSLIELYP